ncbi:F-actin-capping protein subunit alpha [Balamuthia mandrillaris]
MSEVTKEEVVEIVTGFLLNSPPGEFMEVVTDVRGLLPDESVINESAPRTFREYNTDQMLQVQSPGHSHKVLITKFGEVGNSEYLDPRGNQVIHFDHIRQEVTGSRAIGGELDGSIENLRSAFDAAAVAYVDEYYANGTSTVYAKKEGGSTVVTVCISSAKFNPNNYWNGRWRAVWTCRISGGQVDLSGVIKVNVHYYEDGNVQLTTETPKKLNSAAGDPKSTADAALKAISRAEQDFHAKLEQSYATMGDTTFKALRRVLPITRTKIDWTKIQNYKIGGDVGGKPMRGK